MMTSHFCYSPYWEYCTDPLLAGDILEFLHFHRKYLREDAPSSKIHKAMQHVDEKTTIKEVENTLHELQQINRVVREKNKWKMV